MPEHEYLEKFNNLLQRNGYAPIDSFYEIMSSYKKGLTPHEAAQFYIDHY